MQNDLSKKLAGLTTCAMIGILPLTMASFSIQAHAASAVQQQTKSVKGMVVDPSGQPIIGATILNKAGKAIAVTDLDGKFTAYVNPGTELTVSSVGYASKKVKASERDMMITLSDDAKQLQEVQVVAYGAQKKVTVTGAISGINGAELTTVPTASVTNMLAGSVPGISSVQYSGEPGADAASIFVRGKATWANSSPLIQVDGVERDFTEIDPNEIESITVLKDASATAVFGVRGANGVILVTTKRGKEGKAKINMSTSASLVMPTDLLKLAGSYDYALYCNQMQINDGAAPRFSDAVLQKFKDHSDPIRYPDVDWMDYLLKGSALQTQHNINISGGTQKVRYFISLGAFTQDGLFKQQGLDYDFNFKYKRFNYRANLDYDVTKTTTLSLNIGGRVDIKQTPISKEDGNQLFRTIYNTTPFSSPGVIDGRYVQSTTDVDADGNSLPFVGMDGLSSFYGKGYSNVNTNTLNIDVVLNQKLDVITKGLSFKLKGSYNSSYSTTKQRSGGVATYNPVLVDGVMQYRKNGQDSQLGYSEWFGKARDWYMEASLNYSRNFGLHHVGALALYNQSKTYYPGSYSDIPHGYVGMVGRVTYDYANKYMAEFNIGYNGSENFAPGKRYGTFPAGSVGWTISEEKFWLPIKKYVDFLKLRASWGLVGNDQLNGQRFMYTADPYNLYTSWGAYNHNYLYVYNFGTNTDTYQHGAAEGTKHNAAVTWEKSFKQDYGVDAYFLSSRLKATFDYYYERRKDILLTSAVAPGILGFTLPAANLGKVNSWGYEISLKWQDRISNNFRYYVEGNLSYNQNEIKEMMEAPQSYDWLYQKGHRIGSRLIRQFWGLYDSKTSNDKYKAQYGEDLPTHSVVLKDGDAVYVDLNHDGVIDNNDYSYAIGHTDDPEYTAGLNMGFQWKRFEFGMRWTAAWNVSRMLDECFRQPLGDQQEKALLQYQFDNVWTPDNPDPNAKYPRATKLNASNNYAASTLYEVDAKYLRLKSAQIAYHFDFPWMHQIKMTDMTLQLSGYNLLTFSPFKWGDPESRTSSRPNYPLTRSFAATLKLGF